MRNYRGLTFEGKLVKGWYFQRAGASFIIPISDEYHTPASFVLTFVQVIPETVGQQTGLEDRNSQEIYNGDIIQNIEHKNIWVVAWDDKHAKFGYQYTTGQLIDERCSLGGCKHSKNIEYEVIGNIHTHPELMLEQENA